MLLISLNKRHQLRELLTQFSIDVFFVLVLNTAMGITSIINKGTSIIFQV